jgi:hypothetical protein
MQGWLSLPAPPMMDIPDQQNTFAWQPLTPLGVAAFARASLARLLLVQLIVALLAAAIVVWFLHSAWFPSITTAVRQLPDRGQVRAGFLDWQGSSPFVLAQGRFLALTVDLQHQGTVRSPAHLLLEFGHNDLMIFSLLGYFQTSYPRNYNIPFNRGELEPWWGAWSPIFLALAAGSVITGLMLAWAFLATLYSIPAWLLAFFANRDLTWRGSWRLAGASVLPGALLLTGAILLYGLGALDLVRLALAAALHFVLGWVFIVAAAFVLPRNPAAPSAAANPFSRP